MNKTDYAIMEKFFSECLRFWERELKVDSDLDRSAYENAIQEIPKHDPYVPNGRELDMETREQFIKARYMDCYGRRWEEEYNRRKCS